MPVYGERKSTKKASNNSVLAEFAGQFKDIVSNILTESQVDYFSEPIKAMMHESSLAAIKEFFCSDFINECEEATLTPDELEDRRLMQEAQFENDREGLLEHTSMNNVNPLIGMSFPMHKNLLINNVFENGGITKAVAQSPKFTLDMETRYLIGPDGTEIDMYKDQHLIHPMIKNTVPFTDLEIALPEIGNTDILSEIGAGPKDDLTIATNISAILVTITKADSTTEDKWYSVDYNFTPGYGSSDRRQLMESVLIDSNVDPEIAEGTVIKDHLSGFMEKNRVVISCAAGNIKKVKLHTRRDLSNGMVDTCRVRWSTDTKLVEIPEATPINITVTPDEIKDISKLYNVNQLSKIMEMIKDVMSNDKDDTIKEYLDNSFIKLPQSQKFSGKINFALRDGYMSANPKTWRHDIFMDQFDSYVTDMLQVLNDPNMTVTVIGRTELIRKILPVEYTFQTSGSTGAIAMEFQKTVFSSDNRTYEFLSSDKIRLGKTATEENYNDLIVLLQPKGTDRVMYILYDYQLYIANDIKNYSNPTLPSVHAFDRYKLYEYQPVQCRLTIENPDGFTS